MNVVYFFYDKRINIIYVNRINVYFIGGKRKFIVDEREGRIVEF